MKVDVLGSGSRGNALVVDGDDGLGTVLVDCGFGPRILTQRMRNAGVDPQDVAAVLVTHEHADHVCGLRQATRRWKWPVAATMGTAAEVRDLPDALAYRITPGRRFKLAGLSVETFRTPHDAVESVGFVITHQRTGVRLGILYDLGHWTAAMATRLGDLDMLIIEANHDEDMLRTGPYPPYLKARVGGPYGHLSNVAAGRLCRQLVHRGLHTIVLAHLSEHNNTPGMAVSSVRQALRGTGFRGSIRAALQDTGLRVEPGTSSAPRQLALEF